MTPFSLYMHVSAIINILHQSGTFVITDEYINTCGKFLYYWFSHFPGNSGSKESACNTEDAGSIPGSGRFPGEGNGNPLQFSCLGNPMGRGAWWTTIHGVTKSQTWLRDQAFTFIGPRGNGPRTGQGWLSVPGTVNKYAERWRALSLPHPPPLETYLK